MALCILQRVVMPLDDDSSDESQSDSVSETDDADLHSTTSLEDMSRLTANMLLYKAARARNVTVMQDALSQFADVNWKNNDDCGRTPLMQAIFSVCMLCHCNCFYVCMLCHCKCMVCC